MGFNYYHMDHYIINLGYFFYSIEYNFHHNYDICSNLKISIITFYLNICCNCENYKRYSVKINSPQYNSYKIYGDIQNSKK